LQAAKQMSEASVNQIAAAISAFEESTKYKDFRRFHIAQAVAFREKLSGQTNSGTGKPLAKATILSRLTALKSFFLWLAGRPGYRSRISYSDCDYFNVRQKMNISRKRSEFARFHRLRK